VWMIYLLLLYIFWDLLATQTSNYWFVWGHKNYWANIS
jgi:hypothetical protein